MHDPVLEEVVRAKGSLQPHVMSRVQRHLRDVVDQQLGERLQLQIEVQALRAEVEELKDALSGKRRKVAV